MSLYRFKTWSSSRFESDSPGLVPAGTEIKKNRVVFNASDWELNVPISFIEFIFSM